MATKIELQNIADELERVSTKIEETGLTDPYVADAQAFAKQASVSMNKHIDSLSPTEPEKPAPAKKAKSE